MQSKARCEEALAALADGDRGPMAGWLRKHLRQQVLPFWEPLWSDAGRGLPTCVDDAGRVLADDRWLWSQWRAVWVCARIYQTIDRDKIWLERARLLAEFCARHGWVEDAPGWALVVSPDGRVLRGHESIYVDAFAVYGLSELATASGESHWLDLARRTADAALAHLREPPSRWAHFPYPIPAGHQPHGVPMIWSLKLAALAAAGGGEVYADAAMRFADQVWSDFHDPMEQRILETTRVGGGKGDGEVGEVTVPGHAIEGLWFQDVVRRGLARGGEISAEIIRRAMRRHLELGWDGAGGGGLLLAVDGAGRPVADTAWAFADTKLWWPQAEALVASLLAWQGGGEAYWVNHYARLWRLCLEHYVDWERGEWRQKLRRDLQPLSGTIALPVKDPFHLPRSLILQIEMLESNAPPPLTGGGASKRRARE